MTTMLCPAMDRLRAFSLGQLSDEQSDELLSHVGTCTACQAELETGLNSDDSLIVHLRQSNSDSELANEPACEKGILRALGALAAANENRESLDDLIEPSLPKTIGEYEILKSLGHGGMGRVYLARHNKLGRMVALKILARHRLGDRLASQRFESEMRVIGRLAHPNIVIAHDARDIDGTAVLVTEYIDGLDLGQLTQRVGRLEIGEACEIIRQIAEALQYTSDQGFVHRDVKPSNIMVSHTGEVKLLDLGLARLQFGESETAEITGTGQTMGTADYISPEQVTDSRKVDVRSDIYSLGATLYKLLSGLAPFVGEKYGTAFAKMTAHVSVCPTNVRSLRVDVPIEIERLVAAMLSKRPEDRPQRPSEVAIKLSEFARGCELKGLVERATSITISPTSTTATESTSKPPVKPKTRPFLRRPIPMYKAIAAGFFGMVLGLCLGIIITITNPDGSKTTLSIPDGSKVEIAQSGKPTEVQNSLSAVSPTAPLVAPPLQFALMVNRESSGKAPTIGDRELESMLKQLSQTNSNAVVQNDNSRFVRIADASGLDVPISAWNNGIQFALVSTDRNYSVAWDEIEGRILESNSASGESNKEAVLTLKFDKTLGEKMSRVSTAGIGQQLAIMVENIVVQSPKINSKIGSEVQISGVFSPSQVQSMRQYFSRSQSTSTNAIKSSVNNQVVRQFSDEKSSLQSPPTLELVAMKLKVIEIDRMKLRELGIDLDAKNSKLIEKSSSMENPELEELTETSFNSLVELLVNSGAAKVLSQVSPGFMHGKPNSILFDTGKSNIAIEILPTLQGDSALVHFDFQQTDYSKSPKPSTHLPQTTKSRFFSAMVKLDKPYGVNTGLATSMAPTEQLDTTLIMVVSFERRPIPLKQAMSTAIPEATANVNIDLVRMMRAVSLFVNGVDRNFSMADSEMTAKELAMACGVPEKQRLIADAIRKTLPFKGIVSVTQGIAEKEAWLSEKPGTVYSIKVSSKDLLKDVKSIVDVVAGPGVVENVLSGFRDDPNGPQLDVRQIVEDRLREIVVDAENSVIAFKLSDTSSLQTSIERWSGLDVVGPMLIGDYVVFGSKERLQEASKRYAAHTRHVRSPN